MISELAEVLPVIIEMKSLLQTWLPSPVLMLVHHFQRQREFPQFLPRQGHYHPSQFHHRS
jgi:hypothetical protein